ncbi:hypothetical protein Pst134EA_027100 [Puccinia striiformis f. sp. tritici]|uniref:hypothetical protein n=1 Tax=Puccinia striiformis f. sp. tritici TaxID=168172 RepID=UPI00200860D5|nr:hypothetical protein Pst134EA_027100 [Puccinia striiformis f. sp. tritici]KAH9450397.1 hypothetical protein Pst134EA_027100 [Puccinia striiformis f. sp. tritici]
MSACVPCNTAPPPCNCSADQTCVQTPRNCSTCPKNICISDPSSANQNHSASVGAPIGGAIGGLAAGLFIIFAAWILYKRNLLPSSFKAIFQSTNSTGFSNKHPHHLKNQQQQKNKSLNLTSQNDAHHQSVIYLPTGTRDPTTASLYESDDDPFSDKHSGVSIIGAHPKQSKSQPSTPTVELLLSPPHSSLPNAHLPRNSRALSLSPADDRRSIATDHLTIQSSLAEQQQQQANNPTLLVSHATSQSSFLPPSLPSPTHLTANQHRPVRPQRAPDLDLRLPGAANTIPSTPLADDQAAPGNQSTKQDQSLKRMSGSSTSTTHDSHLSSILDPAMIVTPVTLVRTASGRQAAVQRVALRGQEKARVVRLPPSGNPHGPSPLSTSEGAPTTSARANVRETFGFSPTTPGIGRANHDDLPSGANRPTSGQQLSIPSDQTLEFERSSGLNTSLDLDPFSDLSALDPNQDREEDDEDDENTRPPSNNQTPSRKSSSKLRRARSTTYSIASSSFGGSSVCDSYIEDEEVEFPTVLGRSAATLAQRILQQQHEQQQLQLQHQQSQQSSNSTLPSTTTIPHHHVNLKALGRDRAISLSSIITAEAHRNSTDSVPPPPPIPNLPPAKISNDGSSRVNSLLPTPFKPFAGQKPGTLNTNESNQSLIRTSSSSDHYEPRLSSTSTRSGYDSVLEGIPFNIGFSSGSDDLLFNLSEPIGGSSSSSSVGLIDGPFSESSSSVGTTSNHLSVDVPRPTSYDDHIRDSFDLEHDHPFEYTDHGVIGNVPVTPTRLFTEASVAIALPPLPSSSTSSSACSVTSDHNTITPSSNLR